MSVSPKDFQWKDALGITIVDYQRWNTIFLIKRSIWSGTYFLIPFSARGSG